ncbi:MAG: FAD-dependent oxidoreductase [Actinomycetota bacterium]|nr:FAD-dependent oxidoreductase [Actinomycetota bacterium]
MSARTSRGSRQDEARPEDLSFWLDSLGAPVARREPLDRDESCDVAIVGAGFTGLWTAYYLLRGDPSLRVAVVESEFAGFGASGRNGGWCSALFAASDSRISRSFGLGAAHAMRAAMNDSVDEVGRVAALEGIDCHFAKGGTVHAVRNAAQLARAVAEVEQARSLGVGPGDLALLGPDEARERFGADGLLGATYTPHCAAIHPARLVRGLASSVERLGARIYEGTPARAIAPGRVETDHGTVRADVVVRATEGYTARLRGARRDVAPVYSLMIATEPLSDSTWSEIGLARRETFADHRHLVVYGQRTADGRIAFGGRGAPYHFASAIRPSHDRVPRVHDMLAEALVELLPTLAGIGITHRWGGPLGIPRDWFSSVCFDRSSGLASAGGYVGDGVSTTNLAGRTVADLVLRVDSPLTRLPWVGHRSRRWEPEPLRYLGVNAGLAVMTSADRAEERTGRPARRAAWFERVMGV